MINKKYKTFKINISEDDFKCYLIERVPEKNTKVQKIEYEDLIRLLKSEKYKLNENNNVNKDNIFFIHFFGTLFSIYFFISVILYNLIK